MDITELLAFSAQQSASDLHLSAGLPPIIRVDGDIRRINVPALDDNNVIKLINAIMSEQQRSVFEADHEVDFSFAIPGVARFRANVFKQDRGAAAVFRAIPDKVPNLVPARPFATRIQVARVPRRYCPAQCVLT